MTFQTEVKNEKELFGTLTKKIKQSKTIEKHETKAIRTYCFDKFDIDIMLNGQEKFVVRK